MSCGSTICTSIQYDIPASGSFSGFRWPALDLRSWLDKISRSHDRWRQRRQLLELDDRLLADIGLSRHQAVEEARKSRWIRLTMWQIAR